MEQDIFNILSPRSSDKKKTTISLCRYTDYVAARSENVKGFRKRFYLFGLQYLQAHPELQGIFDVSEINNYPELIHLLHGSLLPPLMDEEEALWALSVPNSDTVFYSTDAFYNIMSPDDENGMYASATTEEQQAFFNGLSQVKYALILERCYGIQTPDIDDIVYVRTDKSTGLPKYLKISLDNRFVEVIQKDKNIWFERSEVEKEMKDMKSVCDIEHLAPLSNFSFEGFSIISVTDITARYALHKMRSAIIRHVPGEYDTTYTQIIYLLKALCGRNDLKFGLLPFLRVNGQLVSFYGNYEHSIILSVARNGAIKEDMFLNWITAFSEHPQRVIHTREEAQAKKQDVGNAFVNAGIGSYGAIPVYHNNQLVGMLEVAATESNGIDKNIIRRLDASLSILAQLMFNHQAEFKATIDSVVQTNFTSVQKSVEWKFNEVAWKYLKSRSEKVTPPLLESIRFENVYPIYGAIDIRNSTVERNKALFEDMEIYFSLLEQTLEALPAQHRSNTKDLLVESLELREQLSVFISASNEASIIQFMNKAGDCLQKIADEDKDSASLIVKYFEAQDAGTGAVHQHRRVLETSIQTINGYINQYLELMQSHVQQVYPAYFEKFRTDGVEYDIYVGESIAPNKEYNEELIGQLQMEQIRSMIAIANVVRLNKAALPLPLQTTQLIYVNANPIDISFRTDEKRFDVEGAYNIRYHIVKKRIDKVHIKDTGERLTQPDTIAIVFSRREHGERYQSFIKQLQDEGLLLPITETLALEELQGVSGLHALRVRLA